MADYFHDPYFGGFFPNGFFGPESEANPGAISASLSGGGSLTGLLSSITVSAGHGAGDVFYDDWVYHRAYAVRRARMQAKKGLVAARAGKVVQRKAVADSVAATLRIDPESAVFASVQEAIRASHALLVEHDQSREKMIARLETIIAAIEQHEKDLAEEDDAIAVILLAA